MVAAPNTTHQSGESGRLVAPPSLPTGRPDRHFFRP